MNVLVRSCTDGDHPACRSLWFELTEHHRRIYRDPTIGGPAPGGAFDDYLSSPERVGSWVAVVDGRVVGLTGLLDQGERGEIEPLVVTAELRGRGIGRALIDRVVEEASARGHAYLAVRPVARNVSAVRAFHAAGFHTLGGHIDLTIDLAERRHGWRSGGASIHDRDFQW
jgi:GNAT superfamily N-acetyltransferase